MTEQHFRIVALAPNSWHGAWMNRQQLLSRLGAKHAVLYSTGLWGIGETGRKSFRRSPLLGGFSKADGVIVDASPRLLVLWPRWASYTRGLTMIAGWRWRRALAESQNGILVAYLFHPRFLPYAQALRPDLLVYHAYDFFRKSPGWDLRSAAYEHELLARSDLIIASSNGIADRLRSAAVSGVHVVANGVDYSAFAATGLTEPADLAAIPHPRIGYAGALNRKVDFSLIGELAERNQTWSFIFVGSTRDPSSLNEESRIGQQHCRKLRNVHFLGHKPHYDLPAYTAHMDVNIMCYSLNPALWTQEGYPLKLHEYLAAGKPVVSAGLPAVRPFAQVVRIADGLADWEFALTEALAGRGAGNIRTRREVASRNTWDQRAEQIDRLLQRIAHTAAKPVSLSKRESQQ